MATARRLTVHPSPGPGNALRYFRRDVWLPRVIWNWTWIALAKVTPWFGLKNLFYRMTGMKVGRGVAVGYNAQMDILFPQLITLEEDCIVGYATTILCHEYLRHESRRGPVVVGKDAVVGAHCLILPGVTVAPGAMVSAMSLVNRDVAGFVGGVPARPLKPGAKAEGLAGARSGEEGQATARRDAGVDTGRGRGP